MKYEEAPLYVRAYELTKYIMQRVQRFPKQQRFILGARVQGAALDLLEAVMLALVRRDGRRARLDDADTSMARLIVGLRLARDLGLLSHGSVDHALVELREIGRMLGGWRKANAGLSHADPLR